MADSPYPSDPGPPPPAYPYQQSPAPYPYPQPYQPQYQQPPGPKTEGANGANPIGLVAFIAGMLLLLWPFVAVAIRGVITVGGDFTWFEVFGWIDGGVSIIIGLVALVAGIIAVVQRDRPKVLGAIGLGIGILSVVSAIAYSVMYPLITGFA